MLPKAILFDLDDTILEEDKAADLAWEKVCQIFAAKTGLFKTADLFRRINYNRKHYWTDAKRAATQDRGRVDFFYSRLIIVKSSLDEIGLTGNNVLAEEIVRTFTALKLELTEFVPDAENILRELSKRKIKLALLTNGEGNEQRSKIEKFGMKRFFSICLVEGDLGYGKPDLRIFKLALDSLGVDSKQAWMVGDRLEYDIIGAQQSGIYTVWCDYGKKGLPEDSKVKPDRIIHNLTELLD